MSLLNDGLTEESRECEDGDLQKKHYSVETENGWKMAEIPALLRVFCERTPLKPLLK